MPVQTTDIGWTDLSANHWVGCAKTSEGCAHCWAAAVADRFDRTPEPWTIAHVEENVSVYDEDIVAALGQHPANAPAWCFFPSSSDPFLRAVPDAAVGDYFRALAENDHCCFQVLTKWGPERDRTQQDAHPADYEPRERLTIDMDHVMLGVTVENPLRTYRMDWLRAQDVRTRFVSFEPLLEPIPDPNLSGIDWAIIGGESGDNRREWDPAWARQLVAACREQDVAVFFKQHGDRYPEQRTALDGETIHEFPDLPAGVPQRPRKHMAAADIEHARTCDACGAETYQYERCHVCHDVPWREEVVAE